MVRVACDNVVLHIMANSVCNRGDSHSTPEEYLMTAGNRMSRRQLRQCLKEGKALHAEFWEVPLNHPDKLVSHYPIFITYIFLIITVIISFEPCDQCEWFLYKSPSFLS